jgi:hypothetical protein
VNGDSPAPGRMGNDFRDSVTASPAVQGAAGGSEVDYSRRRNKRSGIRLEMCRPARSITDPTSCRCDTGVRMEMCRSARINSARNRRVTRKNATG